MIQNEWSHTFFAIKINILKKTMLFTIYDNNLATVI